MRILPTNIELKNVKVHADMSQETHCFSATVYIDGKKAGVVSNHGHGGCHNYHPWELQDALKPYADAMPEEPIGFGMTNEDGSPMFFQPDADTLVNLYVGRFQAAGDLRRVLRSRVLFVRDGKCLQTKKAAPDVLDRWLGVGLPKTLVTFEIERDAVLNLLPFDKALALYVDTTATV
jgi:hypothetical protein